MGGEDRLDTQDTQQLEHVLECQALELECCDGILDTAGLGTLAIFEKVIAPAPDTVDPLREINYLEPAGEGSDEVSGERGWPVTHARRELALGGLITVATLDCGNAVELDQLEERLAPLLSEYFAHKGTERVDIVAQCLMLRGKMDITSAHGEPIIIPEP